MWTMSSQQCYLEVDNMVCFICIVKGLMYVQYFPKFNLHTYTFMRAASSSMICADLEHDIGIGFNGFLLRGNRSLVQ